MRYYYKANDGKGFLNLKTPLENKDGYTQMTEAEFIELTKPKFLNLLQNRKLNSINRGKSPS